MAEKKIWPSLFPTKIQVRHNTVFFLPNIAINFHRRNQTVRESLTRPDTVIGPSLTYP